MFSSIRGFLNRHKRKFIVGSVFVGSIIFLTRYTQRKLREWQEKEIRALLERTKKRQYFESTERTCNQMILSLAVTLRNSIIKELETETIINELRSGCTNKVANWNELKILAITRSAVIIYSYTMLVTFIRIQINLIGGHMYKNAQSMDNNMGNGIQAKYMSLSSYFIYDGVKKLSSLVKSKVIEITASMSLIDQLTLRDLEQVYWTIISSISADNSKEPVKNFTYYMLQQNDKEKESSAYSKIIDQTLDLLESDEIQSLMQRNIRTGFVLLIDHIAEYFGDSFKLNNEHHIQNGISLPGTSNQKDSILMNSKDDVSRNNMSTEFLDVNKVAMPMAKIIPIVSGQVPDNATPKDLPADWLERLVLNNDLQTLGANIYEAFSY